MPADDPANLAPQPKDAAKQKDIVEVYLMGQVAAGKMPVDHAQRTAAYDWQNQYQQIPPAERQRIQHSRDAGRASSTRATTVLRAPALPY